ncbi:MAG: hypothetical protein DI630_00730 [Gordonia sp. (in: high G+C Gram-positive bacteria)]|nr:MAG: hypothetical protein DI630_00730 [Gordonia sp. (in: high G+C Gram-positive bacteria)]
MAIPNADSIPNLTRIVVVQAGRNAGAQEFWADSWTVSQQDDGATLKLFACGEGSRPRETRAAKLLAAFGAIARPTGSS